MNKYTSYLLIILLLISSSCFGYNPEETIEICEKQLVPPGTIWPTPKSGEQPIPSADPTPEECGISAKKDGDMKAQVSHGCSIDTPSPIAETFKRSVFKISLNGKCTGVLLRPDWVITAAHCVAEDGTFFRNIDQITINSALTEKSYDVDAAYIPAKYPNLIQDKSIIVSVDDIALLHLAEPLPKTYIPIELLPESFEEQIMSSGMSVWMGGYGDGDKQTKVLKYRGQVTLDASSLGRKIDNRVLYTTSKPTIYKNELSAWALVTPGDSGGPIFVRTISGAIFIAGVMSGVLCHHPYFSKVAGAFAISTNVVPYTKTIKGIMDGTANVADVRCFSNTNGCKRNNTYVLNKNPNNQKDQISTYSILENNNYKMQYISSAETGNYPIQIALSQPWKKKPIVFVANYFDNSISRYEINISGGLTKLPGGDFQLTAKSSPVDIKTDEDKLYVVERDRANVEVFNINHTNGNLTHITDMATQENPLSMTITGRTIFVANNGKIFGGINKSISIYDLYTNILLYNQPLPEATGDIIQIDHSTATTNTQIYLLTTNGVYIYKIGYDRILRTPKLELVLTEKYYFDTSSTLQPMPYSSFAVSAGNSVVKFSEIFTPIPQINVHYTGDTIAGMAHIYISGSPTKVDNLLLSFKFGNQIIQYDQQFKQIKQIQTIHPTKILFGSFTIPDIY